MLEMDVENAFLLGLLDLLETFDIIDNGVPLRLFTTARNWCALL